MAAITKTYTLNDFSSYNQELKNTDLYTFYHYHFDKICDNTPKSLYFCDPFNGDKSLDLSLQEFYRKLERNLKLIPQLSAKSDEEISVDKHKLCFYLKYWFYDRVIAKEIDSTQITQFLSIWELNKREKIFECEHDVKSLPNIKVLKQYYDYYLFLDAYKNIDNLSKEICYKVYRKYLEDARASYSLFTTKCSNNGADAAKGYCKEFNKYIKQYLTIDEESSISCQADELTEEEVDNSRQGEAQDLGKISAPRDRRGDEEDKDDDDNDDDEGAEAVTEDQAQEEEEEEEPQEEEGGMDLRSLSTMGPHIAGHYMPHGSTETKQLMSMTHSSPTSEGTSRKTSTVASVSSVGIGFTLFLLYKFTPVGSFLYPRVQNIKNKINNLIGGQTEVQQDAYNFYPTHMDNNRFNIAYQSG
ncbi:variable surface protein Vir21 [Plasmodium vivax Mauritania I]|uniref:Variable surface protein Vir21 n=1 Tax=Plasmodium vivax Mauritania I TaxID=1035515 RepID=A0A0J9T7D2_PLAVI|nr:variable surface protein Vir21 [Plasmodium vivax Mauritania I]